MSFSRDFIDSCSPKPRRHRTEPARPPPPTQASAWSGGTTVPTAPLGIAQRVDILAQDSLLLPYLAASSAELCRPRHTSPRQRSGSRSKGRGFLTSFLPAPLIIRSRL